MKGEVQMKKRIFESVHGLQLVVTHRRSAVIFEVVETAETKGMYRLNFKFTQETFYELCTYLRRVANEAWTEIIPQEANSFGADYAEYYSRKLENNGYLTLKPLTLEIERPDIDHVELYQFNKAKMASFLYDLMR